MLLGAETQSSLDTHNVIWQLFTFWVDDEALDGAGLQLPVNEVIQCLHKEFTAQDLQTVQLPIALPC